MAKLYPTPRIEEARKALLAAGARSLRYVREKNEHEETGFDNVSFEIFALNGKIVILEGLHPRNAEDYDAFEIFKAVIATSSIDERINAAVAYISEKPDNTVAA